MIRPAAAAAVPEGGWKLRGRKLGPRSRILGRTTSHSLRHPSRLNGRLDGGLMIFKMFPFRRPPVGGGGESGKIDGKLSSSTPGEEGTLLGETAKLEPWWVG